MIRDRDGK